MKREIKFRAWNGEHMFRIEGLRWILFSSPEEGKGVRVDENGQNDWRTLELDKESCALMQYTGLKDKNGKEIYESDIVKSITGFAASSPGEVGVIKWYSYPPGFGVKWAYISNCRLEEKFLEDIEVIGNIYENPELH